MTKLDLILKDLDEGSKTKIMNFLMMCNDLEILINQENMVLLDKGTVAFDGEFTKKINLLNKFEASIRNVLVQVKAYAPENQCLRITLVDRIQTVRKTLSINTTLQLNDLKRRTSRIAVMKEALLDFSRLGEEESVVCH